MTRANIISMAKFHGIYFNDMSDDLTISLEQLERYTGLCMSSQVKQIKNLVQCLEDIRIYIIQGKLKMDDEMSEFLPRRIDNILGYGEGEK